MAPLLAQYRYSLHLQAGLSISPFVVASDQRTIRPTLCVSVYTLVTVVVFVGSYFLLTVLAIVKGDSEEFASSTQWHAESLESLTIGFIHGVFMLTTLLNRRKYGAYVNQFAALYDRWMPQDGDDRQPLSSSWVRNVRRLSAYNICVAALFFVCMSSGILMYANSTLDSVLIMYMYNTLKMFAQTIMFLALMRIRDFALLMGDAIARCAAQLRRFDEPFCDHVGAAEFAEDLLDVLAAFDGCFEVHMLLMLLSDFVFVTSIGFYLLVELFVNNNVSLNIMYYFFCYVVPTILKNIWIVGSVAGLQERVRVVIIFDKGGSFLSRSVIYAFKYRLDTRIASVRSKSETIFPTIRIAELAVAQVSA